jgi:DNA-binding FrmR family transcriptional regulator
MTMMTVEEYNARLERVAGQARHVGKRQYQNEILIPLQTLDAACATAMNEMIRCHSPEGLTEIFSAAWDGLKKIIYEIENGGDNE